MARKLLIICIDGCDPAYIQNSETPTLDQIAREGFATSGRSVVPAVTNVNNTSIITGCFPREHGITTNFWYDRQRGTGTYMEEHEFLLRPTLLECAVARGERAVLLTAKKKLLYLLAGSDAVRYDPQQNSANFGRVQALAAEAPPEALTQRLGPAPDIYSPDINLWLLKAARVVLRESDPDVMYVSTTDYVQHAYAPDHEVAIEHTTQMDALIGAILADDPGREVYVTADHGMRQMTSGVDLGRVITGAGVEAFVQPIIKDRYTLHHNNLSGVAYVYLQDPGDCERAVAALTEQPEVEDVYTREEAVQTFGLHPDRIGDLFVLGSPGVVFGSFAALRAPVDVRSHGSRHESVVPIYGYQASIPLEKIHMNLDIARLLLRK